MNSIYSKSINQFYKKLNELHKSGEFKEITTRSIFHDLIKAILPEQYTIITEQTSKKIDNSGIIYYDLVFGYKGGANIGILEDKGPNESIEKGIQEKRNTGYNFTNILFQNTKEVVLYQNINGKEKKYQCLISNEEQFATILDLWINYKDSTLVNFESSYKKFMSSIPELATEIHTLIDNEYKTNNDFKKEVDVFYLALKDTIGNTLTLAEVKEIIIQHIMTRDLFETILQSSFNKFNSISKLIETIISSLGRNFEEKLKTDITPYYQGLTQSLSKMHNIHYEIEVLRTFYEQFYKAYNPKQADTLGIVYTPVEVVNFMVAMSDHLLRIHFDKTLSTKGVKILDPCTGTGTFITGLLDAIPVGDLAYKYEHDLHANEISILSYYVGSLYIERYYQNIVGDNLFKEFKNMCLVDTLDNIYANPIKDNLKAGTLGEGFGLAEMDEENSKKVKSQNEQDLLVIIGNPPYNANQKNENQNNKNKAYQYIDKRIKETYVKQSQAQKTKVYDMYTRFIRWASDRIGEEGMVAFITNRSFLDATGFDGFRKSVKEEFTYVYTLDLGGDVRKNPKLSGPKNNVFSIQTGVCITFFVRGKQPKIAPSLFYANPFSVTETRINKLDYLAQYAKNYHLLSQIPWQTLSPNIQNQWLNISESNFTTFPIELANKVNKAVSENQFQTEGTTLFGLYSLGIVTARDDWVYDKNKANLEKKIEYFTNEYNKEVERWDNSDKSELTNNFVKRNIKWTRNLRERFFGQSKKDSFVKENVTKSLYRAFTLRNTYYNSPFLIEELGKMPHLFPTGQVDENLLICFNIGANKFGSIITNLIPDFATLVFGGGSTQCLPLYRYDKDGNRHSNINAKMLQSWAVVLGFTPTPEQAFTYVYALLHHTEYREKYALDLVHHFPRLPLLKEFQKLSELGEQLAKNHIHFNNVKPYEPLIIEDTNKVSFPKVKLRSIPEEGKILIDDNTTITQIPQNAWDYKLGNRSAIDWVLEGYKEKKISKDNGDIADENSALYTEYGYKKYCFVNYKEECIDLISKVITVSLETQDIVEKITQISLE